MMSCQQQDRAAAVPVTMATMRIDGLVVAERLAGDPNAPVVVLTPSRDAATSGDRLAHPPAVRLLQRMRCRARHSPVSWRRTRCGSLRNSLARRPLQSA